MNDTKQVANGAASQAGIVFHFAGKEKTVWINGCDSAFTDSNDEDVRKYYSGKSFRVRIKPISMSRLDKARRAHTKTWVKQGVAIHDTDNLAFTTDLFVGCVQEWENIRLDDQPFPCNPENKRRVVEEAFGFANAVVAAALRRGEGVARDEDAEVQRFP